ncbi:unnamed protein product [Heligmosomoides polygyrus]|uniref:EGF-like domain-containing protein n=1 Tax=Heligmosomoides polygyrus TaxID=6339 RepID=A0A183GE40_HELPZ|nr:unnamed protein product [Heligmosomoides polygyrus]
MDDFKPFHGRLLTNGFQTGCSAAAPRPYNGGMCAFSFDNPHYHSCICLMGVYEGERCQYEGGLISLFHLTTVLIYIFVFFVLSSILNKFRLRQQPECYTAHLEEKAFQLQRQGFLQVPPYCSVLRRRPHFPTSTENSNQFLKPQLAGIEDVSCYHDAIKTSSARRDSNPHLPLTGRECSTPLHHRHRLIGRNIHTSWDPPALTRISG